MAIDTGKPVGFGVLTLDDEQQGIDRAGLPGSKEGKGAAFWAAGTAAFAALAVQGLFTSVAPTFLGTTFHVTDRLAAGATTFGGFAASAVAQIVFARLAQRAQIRLGMVLLVGTASLVTFVGAGGLGLLITTGVNLFLPKVLVSGALLVALLALSIDWLGRVVETVARPKGLR
ncbi:6,7-dimethyl-8-ribityllumazine synthase [Bacillus sp. S34]|nr:6,7-dimethyl-8-ribityllumazine synthase [Bacillus sp. S34]